MPMTSVAGRRHRQPFLVCSAVVIAVSITLTACTAQDNIWARREGSSVAFAVCDGISVDSISVLSRTRSWFSSSEDELLWEADATQGTSSIESGEVLFYGVSPDGFASAHGPTDLDVTTSTIVLSLTGYDSLGELVDSQYAVFDGSQLSTKKWKSHDGIEASTPCS
jgi:hypothetical protein